MPTIPFIKRTTPTPAMSPKAILLFNGGVYYNAIDGTPGSPTLGHFMTGPTGARTSRLITDLEGLRVESQKSGWMVMAAGIILQADGGGMTGEDYVNRALLSAEAVMAYRNTATVLGHTYTGPNGSFPAHAGLNGVVSTKKQNRYHNKNMVCHRIASMCKLYRASALQGDSNWAAYTTRVNTIVTQLADYAAWMSTGADIDAFFIRAGNVNQLMSACHFLEIYGALAGDSALRAIGKTRLEQVFYGTATQPPNISPDGVIYERLGKPGTDGFGFDGSYMSFSLETLGDIYESLDAGTWKDTVGAQLTESTLRWMQCISVDGVVSTVNPNVWTRTKQTYPTKPGQFPKGWNWDGISYRLHYMNELLGGSVVPVGLADLVMNIGKAFGHLDGGEEPEGSQFFIILDSTDAAQVDGMSNAVDYAGINPIERDGGGACADYPGGTLPDPCYILPIEVAYDIAHVQHAAYLGAQPYLDVNAVGFPDAL